MKPPTRRNSNSSSSLALNSAWATCGIVTSVGGGVDSEFSDISNGQRGGFDQHQRQKQTRRAAEETELRGVVARLRQTAGNREYPDSQAEQHDFERETQHHGGLENLARCVHKAGKAPGRETIQAG